MKFDETSISRLKSVLERRLEPQNIPFFLKISQLECQYFNIKHQNLLKYFVLTQAEEEAIKAREEKEERERIKEERKELRKKIREREEARKTRAAYLLEMTEKANEFYENKWLVAHFGLAPWKQYVAYARMNMVLAEKFYQVLILLIIYIIIWNNNILGTVHLGNFNLSLFYIRYGY